MTRVQQHAENLRKKYGRSMDEDEIGFLRDMQGMLEFCIRNGLSFMVAVNIINHDINEIARDGFSLEAAKARGFLPKVTGYSKINEDAVGEPEESAD
jgi:hypothetical protein